MHLWAIQSVIIRFPEALLVDLLLGPLAMYLGVVATPVSARADSELTKLTIVVTTNAIGSEWNSAADFRTALVSRSVGSCDAHAT